MYSIIYSNRFKKDVKRAVKRRYDISLLEEAITILQEKGKLPPKYKTHLLSGKYEGIFECHLKPDWLLVWKQDNDKLLLLS